MTVAPAIPSGPFVDVAFSSRSLNCSTALAIVILLNQLRDQTKQELFRSEVDLSVIIDVGRNADKLCKRKEVACSQSQT
jgi:hypothetical protein